MKKVLFTFVFLLSTVSGFAQEVLQNCKMDTTTDKLTLIGVDSVVNVSAADLYLRAITWISKTYKNPDAVIKSRDKEAGIIVLSGFTINDDTKSRLELQFKDGRYRWTLTDFIISFASLRISRLSDKPMERIPRYTESPDKELQLKKDCYKYITSLREAMLQKGEDW
ncbi:DUF4468 domain-containing protein [Prevotella melaninogenica]|uniref:DUF4468 domain-containing protein n=1 Tax=Prevotella melaninogenica TaxID=28132 RepID=UPI001BA651E4|nr:DUF4468 domain-containing protein [Prevotella melaninogenica]QUB67668.1 DUF4468 domain-containing protein [Prevotella melaninogenica]